VRFKSFFRTIYFAPFVTTLVAVAIVWRYLLPHALRAAQLRARRRGHRPDRLAGRPALGDARHHPDAVWKSFGYNMLIFIAGLQAIPEELYEAARIDGAGALQRFRHVTLPHAGAHAALRASSP
jgi:multiple sugar transport system permease protein